jgi:hypothetical protein
MVQEGAKAQVLQYRQAAEDAPALRHLNDALGDDAMRRQLLERFALQHHVAVGHRQDAGDGSERRALAGAIGADQGHDLILAEAERHAAQGVDLAVVDLQVADLEERRAGSRCRFARRRCQVCLLSHYVDAFSVAPR